ncbi:MAG: Tad domain-containing protein [bacterium]
MSIKGIRYKGNKEQGQAIVFVIITLVTLIVFIAAVANVGRELSYKIQLQNTADSASMAGAVWEARGLNLIAGLNQGIVLSVELIVIVVSAIAILGVCSATLWWAGIGEACASALPPVLEFANDVIPRLWNTATEMSRLEKKIAQIFPDIVPVAIEVAGGANPDSPLSIPYPYQPSGDVPPPLSPQAISLNVDNGAFGDLIKAIINDISRRLDKIFPLLSKALSVLGKSIDLNALSPDGSISTTFRDSHSYDNYAQAVDANNKAHEPAEAISNVSSIKKIDAGWFYITTYYNRPDPCNNCSVSINKQSPCSKIAWSKDEAPPEKITSNFVNCVVKDCSNGSNKNTGNMVSIPLVEQTFCKFNLNVETTTKTNAPAQLPFPMKLHQRADEFLYIAVATTDLGRKRAPVFISNKSLLKEDKNPWGFIALSQAKPQSLSTKPGDVLLEMDWDAHLTRFTALKAIADQIGSKSVSSVTKWLNDKLILH